MHHYLTIWMNRHHRFDIFLLRSILLNPHPIHPLPCFERKNWAWKIFSKLTSFEKLTYHCESQPNEHVDPSLDKHLLPLPMMTFYKDRYFWVRKGFHLPIFVWTVTMMSICFPWFSTWNYFASFISELYRYFPNAFAFKDTRLTSRPSLEVLL